MYRKCNRSPGIESGIVRIHSGDIPLIGSLCALLELVGAIHSTSFRFMVAFSQTECTGNGPEDFQQRPRQVSNKKKYTG